MASNFLKRPLDLENSLMGLPLLKRRRHDEFQDSCSNAPEGLASRINAFSESENENFSPNEVNYNVQYDLKGQKKDNERQYMNYQPESNSLHINSVEYNADADKTLFTFDQVVLICQKMLHEREEDIREKYDEFLRQKLAEQYDAFIKFKHDQIQRDFERQANYYIS